MVVMILHYVAPSQGFWTIRGGQLAKKVRSDCIPCRKVDSRTMQQPMGDLPQEVMKDPFAWSYCQIDLFGPFSCRGDVSPRTTKKTWGMLIEDVNTGGVYIDIVQDYSTAAVMLTLRRYGSLRGWPGVITTDPGSQLESARGILEQWRKAMKHSLQEFSSSKNFEWKVSPPDSPWREGKAERRIGIVKKLIHHSVGDSRLTPVELQTTFFDIANICNERPLGLPKPREDGSYVLITPNQLLMGRSQIILPDDTGIVESLPMTARYRLVKHGTDVFWQRWCMYVSPALIVRQKWHIQSRNLSVGDLVMICEHSNVKSKYKLGIEEVVKRSDDDVVRSATKRYCYVEYNSQGDDRVTTIRVDRNFQRLVLIMPVEEMSKYVVVKDYGHSVKCTL